ncbi:MAG: IS3 family transposase, partial [Clostridium septicum]|uniref:IS3 family transposase n=2 Tax=Clostridium TaxID=1485 RepID=UPI0029055427
SRSTYYYNLNYKVKDEDKVKAVGRKPVGYSLTKNNKKIYDDEIKEYIMESINGDAQYYGYRKITYHLRRTYNLIINCKKVYRLCKELNILKCQRKIHFKTKRILASNRTVTASNQVWEIDIKYGYVHGEDKFFYTLNVIDVFDRSIIDYHMGLHCEARDAAALIRHCLIKQNLFIDNVEKPVIRSDNGPQFISHKFEETCSELHIEHERIPVKTPNKNAHIESFHRILEDECFKINEFQTYAETYKIVNTFMSFYNERRLHSSLKYMPPREFYTLYFGEHVEKICIKI